MIATLAMAALGLVILVLAGDALVRGAVDLALRLGIPPLIVGLTVVACGTSAPELLVSVKAVLDDAPGIAFGNVVGSNIANVLLVLGLPAIFATIHCDHSDTPRSYVLMLLATGLFIGLCFAGPLGWMHGLVLLTALALVLRDNLRAAVSVRGDDALPADGSARPWWTIALLVGIGLVGLPLGAEILVDSAVEIARGLGVSEAVIGLTLVALGTSLPELATSVMAALKGEADVAMGNVIGSNIFNLLGIVGVAALVGPMPVPEAMLRLDLWVMLAASLALGLFALAGRVLTRGWGLTLVGGYLAYVLALLT